MSRGSSRRGKNTIPVGFFAALALLALIAASARLYREAEDKKERETAESIAYEESIAASIAESEAEAMAASLPELALCDDPLITEAVTNYFNYRLSADVSSLLRLFGRADQSIDETLETKLTAQAAWVQGFNDILVYTAPSPDGTYIFGIATYVIDFRRTDEMAPGIMYFFISYDENGEAVFEENPVRDKLDFAGSMLETDLARALIEETDTALKEALDNNSTLSLIYTSFIDGAIYLDTGFDPEREQEVDVFTDPADSVLVDEEALKRAEEEVLEAESIEASLAAEDVYLSGGD